MQKLLHVCRVQSAEVDTFNMQVKPEAAMR